MYFLDCCKILWGNSEKNPDFLLNPTFCTGNFIVMRHGHVSICSNGLTNRILLCVLARKKYFSRISTEAKFTKAWTQQ